MTDLRTRLIAGMARAIDPDAFTSPNINSYARERLRATQDSARALDVLAATLDAEGWQLAPKKATAEMRTDGAVVLWASKPASDEAGDCYAAMLAIAPNPLAAKEPDHG